MSYAGIKKKSVSPWLPSNCLAVDMQKDGLSARSGFGWIAGKTEVKKVGGRRGIVISGEGERVDRKMWTYGNVAQRNAAWR